MDKVDRRVRRTRTLLGQALHDLILEKPYDAITIQDITDRADLNRATFYLHYASKEALLMGSLVVQFDELVQRMEAEAGHLLPWESPAAARVVLDYAAENASLYKVLLGQNGQGYVMYWVVDYIARYDEQKLRSVFGDRMLAVPIPILARQFAGSFLAVITWWLEADMPYSAEHMSEIIQRLCMTGLRTVIEEAALA